MTPILKDASKNKIFKLQQAASEALKFWEALKSGPEENNKLRLPKNLASDSETREQAELVNV